jgi:Predicted membrane protein (DUF2232)
MLNRIGMGIGAGLASALLFVVTVQGTALALALAYLAPLPIMIATLGWGVDAGLVALCAACAVVAGAIEPFSGMLFGLTVALPAWGLAAFAALHGSPWSLDSFRRPPVASAPLRPSAAPSAGPGVGTLVVVAAGVGIAIGAGALVAMIVVYGGYQKGVETVATFLRPAIEEALGPSNLPDGFSLDDILRLVVKFSPPAIACSTTLMFAVNLYAAARSAQLSQRLTRSWPDVPTSLVLPPALGAILIVALGTWLAAPEPTSQFAALFVGGLGVVYVLQGLAVLHALSRRVRGRPALIAALYVACLVAPKWVLPAVATIGLIESVASLRARAAAPKFGA